MLGLFKKCASTPPPVVAFTISTTVSTSFSSSDQRVVCGPTAVMAEVPGRVTRVFMLPLSSSNMTTRVVVRTSYRSLATSADNS